MALWRLTLIAKARGLSKEWLASPGLSLDGVPIPLDADGCLRINYIGPAGTVRTTPFHEVLAAAGQPEAPKRPFVCSKTRSC